MKSATSANKKYIVILAHIAALLTVSAWGSSFLCTKILMTNGGFTPVEMYVYRFAAAYLVLLLFTFRKIFSNSWRDELTFMICGICAGSLYFVTENYALKYTTAGNVSLLSSISPLITTFLTAILLRQRVKGGIWLGSAVALAGVVCVIFSHGESLEIRPAGDILALSASFSWAIYTIAVKRVQANYSSFFITRKLFFYGVLTAIPLLLFSNEPLHLSRLFDLSNPSYIFNFVFLVLMCSIMAYLIWNEAMKYLGAVAANNYLYMQPMVTMIAAYFFLDEKIYLLGYLGCALIIGGLIISDKVTDLRLLKNR